MISIQIVIGNHCAHAEGVDRKLGCFGHVPKDASVVLIDPIAQNKIRIIVVVEIQPAAAKIFQGATDLNSTFKCDLAKRPIRIMFQEKRRAIHHGDRNVKSSVRIEVFDRVLKSVLFRLLDIDLPVVRQVGFLKKRFP